MLFRLLLLLFLLPLLNRKLLLLNPNVGHLFLLLRKFFLQFLVIVLVLVRSGYLLQELAAVYRIHGGHVFDVALEGTP